MNAAPPLTAAGFVAATLRERGWAVVGAEGFAALAGVERAGLAPLASSWGDLPPDTWLRDGGKYRARRHSCFVVGPSATNGTHTTDDTVVTQAPHRAHWQSADYNALHGGLERWFEAVRDDVIAAPVWAQLLRGLAALFTSLAPTAPTAPPRAPWFVEAHQFRIDTREGIGRPTPEGAHRDGVDFVVVLLVERAGIKGGETRVFDAHGTSGVRFTLDEPWSALLLDDARVIHETTPIQRADEGGHRDTLVLTFRRGAFQGR